MIERYLGRIAFSDEWGRQMRFIAGPRQAGKTTLAKALLSKTGSSNLYYLWDSRLVRERYKENELFFTSDIDWSSKDKYWLCFDEVHKYPKWKNVLKGVYDQVSDDCRIIVTGSAKLNILKRAGDSLAGRYFTFHLFPLILSEVKSVPWQHCLLPDRSAADYLSMIFSREPGSGAEDLAALLEFGGFPEPFLSQNSRFHRKWQNEYIETVIREDIGSLTRIIDREYIFDLYNLLPEMVGSPISESSLASHIQVSPPTIKNYLRRLEDFYLTFSLRPYSKNIKRSLLRASKCYLYDWTKVAKRAARFENYVACELKANLSLWSDLTGEMYELFYIRNKEKKESDFLILRNKSPWLLVEVKLSDMSVEKHHIDTSVALGGVPVVQVCMESGIMAQQSKQCFRVSADRFFG
jgi:predicted AAA+ superfamily ATPase